MRKGGIKRGVGLILVGLAMGCGSGGGSGGGTSTSTSAATDTKSAASVSKMAVGDIYVPSVSSGSTEINFSGASASASYILMVQSASSSPSSASAQFKSAIEEFAEDGDEELLGMEDSLGNPSVDDVESDLHLQFRDFETDFAAKLPVPPEAENQPGGGGFSLGKAVGDSCPSQSSFTVGSTRTFKVLTSLSSTTSTQTVSAELKYVTEDVLVYVDARGLEDSFSGKLATSEIQALAEAFQYSYDIIVGIAGVPADVDANCKVIAFLTLAVNELGSSGGGIITGFFYAADEYPSHTASNAAEILHLIYPDPAKEYSVSALSKNFVKTNLLTAVFGHELQHLINYNQKVFLNGVGAEAAWVNEMESHWIENRVGYSQENYSRYDLFNAATNTSSLIPSGSPNIVSRGGSYLFLQYLSEQAANADTFVGCMIKSSKSSVANIEACFNGPSSFNEYSEFLLRWGIAMALTDRGVTTDSEFTYKARTYNSTTGHWQGVCMSCAAQDGRGTMLNGVSTQTFTAGTSISISNSAQKYYLIPSGASPATLAINLNASLNPQVVLMRIQ